MPPSRLAMTPPRTGQDQHPAAAVDDRVRLGGTLVVVVLLVVGGTLASWFRLPAAARGAVWAEDGRNFIGDRVAEGPLTAVLRVYEGYLHVVPRLIAEVVVAVAPIDRYAAAMTAASCAVVGLVAGLVFVTARSVVPAVVPRLALALVPVVSPAAPLEVLGNAANVHWYLLWATPWVLLSAPRSRIWSWVLAVFVLLAALTEIQLLLFAPLLLLVLRDRRSWPLGAALLLGGAAQVLATLSAPRTDNPNDPVGAASAVLGFALNPVAAVTHGESAAVQALVVRDSWWPIALTAVVVAASAVFVLLRGGGRGRVAVLVCGGSASALWLAAVTLNPHPRLRYAERLADGLPGFGLERYAVVPSMFLTAVVLLAAALLSRTPGRAGPAGALLATLVVVVQLLQFSPAGSWRALGPSWVEEVDAAEAACLQGDDLRELTTAPLRPSGRTPWVVSVPCDDLLDDRVTP